MKVNTKDTDSLFVKIFAKYSLNSEKKIDKNLKTLWLLFMDGLQFPQGLESLQGGSLLFTTKFPEILGTLFNYLGKMKG